MLYILFLFYSTHTTNNMAHSEHSHSALQQVTAGSTPAQTPVWRFSRLIEPNPDSNDDTTPVDTRKRTIIFTGSSHLNAYVEDRLVSADQTSIFKFRPVDVIILGNFSRTQIKNRPSYLNALLIQSRGIDAKNVSNFTHR